MSLSEELAALDRIKNKGTSVHEDINFRSNCRRAGVKGVLLITRFGAVRIIEHTMFGHLDMWKSPDNGITWRPI